MSEGSQISSAADIDSPRWWSAKRIQFNIVMIFAALLAEALYLFVFAVFPEELAEIDLTLFTVFFQGVLFLFALALANLCFSLGPLVERRLAGENAALRKCLYVAGTAFSLLLISLQPIPVMSQNA